MIISHDLTALYERLSHDDELQGESNSISNQKAMFEDYAEKNGFTGIRHFTDDGISGTTFEREGLQAMLAEVEKGNIGTIIVKDMSRLGRNYVQMGMLREQLRRANVRLIAVNEGVDTGSGYDDDFLPFRDVINEYYAKDISKKIKSTFKAKGESGKHVAWEHRSFKEQGIDREPTIHIGAVTNALERKGIQTERGNINREIIKNNMLLEQAKEMLMLAKQELHSAQYKKIKNTAVRVKNEVMEMIAKVRKHKGILDLPIVSGKHLRRISVRTAMPMKLAMQSADNAERFITTRKIDSFESLAKYPELKERMQSLLQNGEKIMPKQWKAEIQSLQSEYDNIGKEQTKTATELVISYNKKNLERELQNESRQQNRQQSRTKRRAEEI